MTNTNTHSKRTLLAHPLIRITLILLFFVGISLAYFYPAAFEGRRLFQMDGAGAAGVARDVTELKAETGHRSLWTGSLFGGMPMYQISPTYPSGTIIQSIKSAYRLSKPIPLLPGDTYLIFMLLLGFYLFMRSWGIKRNLSVLGALMWAFSSYFLILIDAGHIWKLETLCYIPPTIAGLVYAFKRRKYALSFVVTGLFTALQILANHVQMSYYFAFLMLAMVIGWGVEAYRTKQWKHFGISLTVVLTAAAIGVLINSSNLYHTYTYSKHTMRGGSEVVLPDTPKENKSNPKGLDKEYITQWSYGIDEMLTFIIPNAKGGASGYIGHQAPGMDDLSRESRQFVAQQNKYWGDQPFTAGPVYVSILVVALAIFGSIVTKGSMRWALIGVTILTILLSWGHHLMGLSSLFIDYFPLYDKFRTVSSILVVPQFTLPLLAILGLQQILKGPDILKRKSSAAWIAIGCTGGIALLLALLPSLGGSYLSDMEKNAFAPYLVQNPQVGLLIKDLKHVREAIFVADAWRSVVFVLLGMSVVYLFYKRKLSQSMMVLLLGVVILIDLWSVDKRYLNDSKYLPSSEVTKRTHTQSAADEYILQDHEQFRVMNLTVDTFNDATTSYLHRSIGGYHAAKLQRYQDVIQGYLSKRNLNVLRALNTKYYIVNDSVGQPSVTVDPEVYGSAWFVDRIIKVDTPQEEFDALGSTPLDRIAIVAPPFSQSISETTFASDSTAHISLTSYSPDRLCYVSESHTERLAVFSEIYYPDGWIATIDGKEADIYRADYLLRALRIPPGSHTIVFEFAPKTIAITETISYAATTLLLLASVAMALTPIVRKRKQREKHERQQ